MKFKQLIKEYEKVRPDTDKHSYPHVPKYYLDTVEELLKVTDKMYMEMAKSQNAVLLTERQWDHIIIALELHMEKQHNHAVAQSEADMPYLGTVRSLVRFRELYGQIITQLGLNDPSKKKYSFYLEEEDDTWSQI